MKTLVDWHRKQFPAMESQDVVKLIFQAMMGCGHLLKDEQTVVQRIQAEEVDLIPTMNEPLIVPIGKDFARLNLRRAMAEGIFPRWIARLMMLSCREAVTHTRSDVAAVIETIGDRDAVQLAQKLIREPAWIPSHTAAYHQAYAPAYRVISSRFTAMLPVLSSLAAQWDKEQLLVCIDGPCGSGKTTLARMLVDVLDAALVSMDDFFLPHARKTQERLSQPGGNADWERLVEEFLLPWKQAGKGAYRRYDCHADGFGDLIDVPMKKVTIIEGSYSLMPDIARHADVRIFIRIDEAMQHWRIRQRDGEKVLQMFIDQWIPLEKAYHTAMKLPDDKCLVLDQSPQE